MDKATGKIVWNKLAHEAVPRVKRHPKATACHSTPATDGSRMVHSTYCAAQYVTVAPGQPTVIRYGFNGWQLKGRLVASDTATKLDWKGGRGFSLSTKLPPVEPPPGEDPQAWQRNYWASAEGQQRQRDTHHFGVAIGRKQPCRLATAWRGSRQSFSLTPPEESSPRI